MESSAPTVQAPVESRRARGRPYRSSDALALLVEALPLLRGGLTVHSAQRLATLLRERLSVDAVAIVDTETVLARDGIGSDHHCAGGPIVTELTKRALASGEMVLATGRRAIGCPWPRCPLGSALVVPLRVRGRVVGALKLYRARPARIGRGQLEAAAALGRLFGVYLELAELDLQASRVVRAELEALRAQISPHFLFNTLNTIASLINTEPRRAHDLVIEFAEFFRETLAQHGEFVTLADELAYVQHYLDFERARLGARLAVRFRVEPEAYSALLPVLVVQPLVENAVNHGIEPRPEGGLVEIHVVGEGRGYRIVVRDDGVGMPPERVARVLERGYGTGLGMGLNNVDQRLKSIYGQQSGLCISSVPGQGTTVTFWVPSPRGGE